MAAAVVVAVIAFGNPFGGGATPSASASAAAGSSGSPHGDGTCPTAPPGPLAAGEQRTVTIETDQGDIVIEVAGAGAPNATGNFVALVECEFYDGLVFHRLVPGFVIQGGDPDGNGSGGPGYSITDDPLVGEYRRGTVAMARQPRPNTQGSQFFIVLSDEANPDLLAAEFPYAILGQVTSGMEAVDAIAAMPNTGPPNNAAVDPVAMTRVTVSSGPAASASPGASAPASPGASGVSQGSPSPAPAPVAT